MTVGVVDWPLLKPAPAAPAENIIVEPANMFLIKVLFPFNTPSSVLQHYTCVNNNRDCTHAKEITAIYSALYKNITIK